MRGGRGGEKEVKTPLPWPIVVAKFRNKQNAPLRFLFGFNEVSEALFRCLDIPRQREAEVRPLGPSTLGPLLPLPDA